MATKTVSVRIDEDLYREFSEFASRVFIPVSALISAFAATTVRDQRLPFTVTASGAVLMRNGNGNGNGDDADADLDLAEEAA